MLCPCCRCPDHVADKSDTVLDTDVETVRAQYRVCRECGHVFKAEMTLVIVGVEVKSRKRGSRKLRKLRKPDPRQCSLFDWPTDD